MRIYISRRVRWRYSVTWEESNKANCDGPISYELEIGGSTTLGSTSPKTTIFYIDGYELFNITLVARNSVGPSTQVTRQERSDELTPQFADSQVTLTAISSYCVRLNWRTPLYPGGPINRYQYKCNSNVWTNTESLSGSPCGYLPYTEVSCLVRANNSAGAGLSVTKLVTTTCAEPTEPRAIQLSSTEVDHDNRRRWQYRVTWTQPARSNCYGIIKYQYGFYGLITSLETPNRRATFYIDGDQNFNATVIAKNAFGSSTAAAQSGKSDALAPQFASPQVTLTSISPHRVRLNWESPLYPGGSITSYQYKCDGGSWTGTQNSSLQEKGGYQPYTNVTCQLRAVNIKGSGRAESRSVNTDCTVPGRASNLLLSPANVPHSERRRWRYTVTGQPPSRNNCFGGVTYRYRITNGSTTFEQVANSGVTFVIDGDQLFSVSVEAGNSVGFSPPITVNGTSNELAPQFRPRGVTLVAESSTAVRLSWRPPLYPGGTITHYQHQCGRYSWTNVTDTPTTAVIDGFPANTNVTCRVRALNSAGRSELERKVNKTACGEPKFLAEILYEESYENSTEKRVIVFSNEQEINLNCDSLHKLEYKVGNVAFQINNTFGKLPALTNYTAAVKATNNAGNFSTKFLVIQTGELKPYDAPNVEYSGPTNLSCVTAIWSLPSIPNGIITEYKFRCTDASDQYSFWTSTGLVQSFIHCGYSAGDLVTCEIRAHTRIGAGPANQTRIEVRCVNLVLPNFEVSSFAALVMGTERVTISLNLELPELQCQKNTWYNVSITEEATGSTKHYMRQSTGILNFTDFDAYTEYNISLLPLNSGDSTSINVKSYSTIEIAPQTEPTILVMVADGQCVNLTATEPTKPNGKIINYQFACTQGTNFVLRTQVEILSGSTEGFDRLCGLQHATAIECSVAAANSAGLSPTRITAGYTAFKVRKSAIISLEPPSRNNRAVIRIYNVELEMISGAAIRSYFVILQEEPSISRICLVWHRNITEETGCYTMARLDSALITGPGYIFNIGDGKVYGGFYNALKQNQQSFLVKLAISIELEDGTFLNQILDASLKFKAIPTSCDSPPSIDGAQASRSAHNDVGESVLYACDSGRLNSGGDLELICQLNKDYESEWIGERLMCSKIDTLPKEIWIGVGVAGAIVVGCTILAFICVLKRRGWGRSTADNSPAQTQDDEYAEVVSPDRKPDLTHEEVELENYKPSHIQCVQLERTSIANAIYEELPDRPASTSDIYSSIPGEGDNSGAYEAVNLRVTEDHLYSAIGY